VPIPLVKVEDWLDRPLDELKAHLLVHEKVQAAAVTLRDLAETYDHPNGVYLFFRERKGGECLYVGKVSSRSYAGRIPSHFEPRKKYWMNYLSRRLGETEHSDDYSSGIQSALKTYLLLLGVFAEHGKEEEQQRKYRINSLEPILRTHMSPLLNRRRGVFDGNQLLRTFL
jgi:hypothetical protein